MKRWQLFILVLLLADMTSSTKSFSQTRARIAGPMGKQTAAWKRPELLIPLGQLLGINAIAYSPDGKILATAGDDASIIFWDVKAGRVLRTIATQAKEISSLAYSPDGRYLASGGDDQELKVWNADTGAEVRTISEVNGTQVAFSRDSKSVAGMTEGFIKFWSVASGDEVKSFAGKAPFALSTDGKTFAAKYEEGVTVRDFATGDERYRVASPDKHSLLALALSPDGKLLAVASGLPPQGLSFSIGFTNHVVRLFNAETGSLLRSPDKEVENVNGLLFSPDSRLLATAHGFEGLLSSSNGRVKLWDAATGRELHTFEGYENAVTSIAFSPNSPFLTSGSGGGLSFGEIKVWNVVTGKQAGSLSGHASSVFSIDISPDGRTLASAHVDLPVGLHGSDSAGVRLWDFATGKDVRRIPSIPIKVAFSGDGKFLAQLVAVPPQAKGTAEEEEAEEEEAEEVKAKIVITDIATGKEYRSLGDGEQNSDMAFSSDGKSIAGGGDPDQGDTREITVWDVESSKKRFSFQGTVPISFTPDGKALVFHEENKIVFLDAFKGDRLKSIPCEEPVSAIAFSSDGNLLAWGEEAEEKDIHVWDINAGKQIHNFTAGGGGGIVSLSFSKDGTKLAAGGETIKVWDMKTGGEVRSFPTLLSGLMSFVRFSEDASILISATADKKIRLWDMKSGKELADLISIDGQDWMIVTPEGVFDGSPRAWNQVFWRFSDKLLDVAPVEAYFYEFFRPGLLTELFAGERPPAPSEISEKNRLQPQLKLSLAGDPVKEVSTRNITVKVDVSEAPAGAQDVRLFRNGALVKTWDGDVLKDKKSVTLEATITVIAGDNRLTAYAFNRDNIKSPDASLDLSGAESLRRPRTTHIVAIGINEYAENPFFKDLSYAERDAKTVSDDLAAKQKALGQKVNVVPPLYSGEATKEKILAALKSLAGRVEPEDSVVVYYSGHGKATNDGRFYIIPHDVGYPTRPEVFQHSISEVDLEEAFRPLDAGQVLLIIDACNSGQAMVSKDEWRRGPMNSRGLAQLAYEKGMYLLAASQGYQIAREVEGLGGLLTYVLINEGLTARADSDPPDGRVTSREWLDYAVQGVPRKQREMIEAAKRNGTTLNFNDVPKGDEKSTENAGQTPRVFYRREADVSPFIVALLNAGQ